MTTRIAPGVGANLLGQHSAERNQDATAYVGNLDPQVLFCSFIRHHPYYRFEYCRISFKNPNLRNVSLINKQIPLVIKPIKYQNYHRFNRVEWNSD
ncbi:hypothetical protein HanLR1_Chr05g0186561 [Helianthus annuus]|nr:hypothetical protein HanLR1_Chr05g0186561 [Helianthus annuus]